VIVQDDCVPVPQFTEAAANVREAVGPGALILFCLQGMVQWGNRSRFWAAMPGPTMIPYRPHNWVPAMAIGWTPELARRALDWDAHHSRLSSDYTSDDGQLCYFTRWGEVPCWATVPCLVDHADDVGSVRGGNGEGKRRPSRRTLALYPGDDAGSVMWRCPEVAL
jgi:hypothetical protein